jgi:hypothetical protein
LNNGSQFLGSEGTGRTDRKTTKKDTNTKERTRRKMMEEMKRASKEE